MSEQLQKKVIRKKKRNSLSNDIDFPGPDKIISIKLKDQPEKFFSKPYQAWDYLMRMRPPKKKKKLNKEEKKELKQEFKKKEFVSFRKEDGEINPDE